MVVHSDDKYFYRSDGVSKKRESVVIAVNRNNEVALVKLTTSSNSKYKDVLNYPGSRYMTEDVYTVDNDKKRICVYDSKILTDETKFIPSTFKNIPLSSVGNIITAIVNDKRFGARNKYRLEQLKKT